MYGVYSLQKDVDIYEMLTARYLMDKNGNLTGMFTGETAQFLNGEITDEPETISLVSSRVVHPFGYVAKVCGRNVQIKTREKKNNPEL